MATDPQPAIDHPGTFILEELEARAWTQADLAYILGWDGSQLNRLIKGVTDITPDSAVALGEAFDMPPEFFLNLQKMYDLQTARKADPGVRTRASWVSVFPVREMIKRGWIEDTEAGLLDLQMMRFFEKNRVEDIPFVSDTPLIPYAARKTGYESMSPTQYVWLSRVRKIAQLMECPLYSRSSLEKSLGAIRAHMLDPGDIIHIPEILKKCGVRFVLVEALPGSKIDGVCVWLDDAQPVIGMSLRLDRLDNFCFVIRHEIEHILREDGKDVSFAPVDEFPPTLAFEGDLPECEIIANGQAAEFCVPQELVQSFILRKSPFISERDVLAFASRVEIHPAVVIGQIQNHTKKFGWLRRYQTSIKPYLEGWDFRDGWGVQAPTGL